MRALRVAAPVLGALAIWALASPTLSSFSAQVRNNVSKAGTTATLLTATDTAGNNIDCTSNQAPISSTQSVACSRSTLPASVASSGTTTQQVTLSSSGGANPTQATYTASSCGPVKLADQTASSDPMLARGGVSYAQAGPLTGSASLGLDGSSGLAADIVSTSNATLGSTFTIGIWFKVANGYTGGGTVLGFGSSASTVSDSSADKILSMTTAGKLNFAIAGTLGTSNTTTSSAYNDGSWHFATVTVASVALSSITIYVDGSQAAQSLSVSLLTGYTGYWHAGWSPVGSGSAYLAGDLADAFVVDGTALNSTQVSTLHAAGSQTTWNSDLSTDGASESWGLADSGTTTYSGTLPVIGTTDPCSMISIAVGATSFCIYSPGSTTSACVTPTGSSNTLAQWVAAGAQSFPATTTTASATITTTLIRSSTYNTTFMPGLRLYVPVILTEKLTASSPWYTTLSWTSTSQQVTA
jgi:hypothetical protein